MPEFLTVTGTIEAMESSGVAPTQILPSDENWRLRVQWDATFSALPASEGDIWHLKVYLESLATEPEIQIPDTEPLEIPVNPGLGTFSYSHEIDVEAGALSAGIYKVVAVLTYRREGKETPSPVEGPVIHVFVEGPVIQVYSTRF